MSIDMAMRELVHSPEFLEHIARLKHIARGEQQRRERFYEGLHDETRAEFINGRAVVHAPASRRHQRTVFLAANLLGEYAHRQDAGEVYSAGCVVRCQRNDYAPDICLFGPAKSAHLTRNQRIFPPPDLIVEVLSPETEVNDRTLKLSEYARHGVAEYWIIDPRARTVEKYVLPWDKEEYAFQGRLAEGWRLVSALLPGFAVPVNAIFDVRKYQQILHGFSAPP